MPWVISLAFDQIIVPRKPIPFICLSNTHSVAMLSSSGQRGLTPTRCDLFVRGRLSSPPFSFSSLQLASRGLGVHVQKLYYHTSPQSLLLLEARSEARTVLAITLIIHQKAHVVL